MHLVFVKKGLVDKDHPNDRVVRLGDDRLVLDMLLSGLTGEDDLELGVVETVDEVIELVQVGSKVDIAVFIAPGAIRATRKLHEAIDGGKRKKNQLPSIKTIVLAGLIPDNNVPTSPIEPESLGHVLNILRLAIADLRQPT